MQLQELATWYQLFACGIQNVSFCTSIPNFQSADTFENLNSVFSSCLSPHNQLFLQQVEYNYKENFQIKKPHNTNSVKKQTGTKWIILQSHCSIVSNLYLELYEGSID